MATASPAQLAQGSGAGARRRGVERWRHQAAPGGQAAVSLAGRILPARSAPPQAAPRTWLQAHGAQPLRHVAAALRQLAQAPAVQHARGLLVRPHDRGAVGVAPCQRALGDVEPRTRQPRAAVGVGAQLQHAAAAGGRGKHRRRRTPQQAEVQPRRPPAACPPPRCRTGAAGGRTGCAAAPAAAAKTPRAWPSSAAAGGPSQWRGRRCAAPATRRRRASWP